MKTKKNVSRQSAAVNWLLVKLFVLFLIFNFQLLTFNCFPQGTAINTTGASADASSILDITSSDKGLLVPRMTTAQRNAIASPTTGLWIYNTDCNEFQYYNASNWVSLINGNSLPVTTATAATNLQQTSLSANWNSVTGASTYYLDVSTVSDFSSFVTGYNNLNVGNVVTYGVTGITCNTAYYYRIRAGNSCSTSSNSNLITATTSACPPPPCAQLQRLFGGTGNDEPTSVQQTSDGGYIMAGYTGSFGGAAGNNPYLLKTDLNGDFVWNMHYNTAYAIIYSMQQTSDGGYIMAGGVNNGTNEDFYLLKTDASGTLSWCKTIGKFTGLPTVGNEDANSIQQTSDGGYIIAGYTLSYGAGSNDCYLVKTDGSGNISWSKTYGSTSMELANSVRQTNDGGYIIAGWTNAGGNQNILLIKTDGSGNLSWSKTYGGTGDVANSVQQTSDGGYIIAGYTSSYGAGNNDCYLIKTDGSGNISWTKTYGGTNSDLLSSVQQTNDGGYILIGSTKSFGAGNYDTFLIKTDGSGNLSWAKTFGGTLDDPDSYNDGLQTSDGGYVITTSTQSFGAGNKDVYLIKTDANGDAGGCNTSSPTPTVGSGGSATTITPTVTSPASGISAPAPTINSPVPTISTPCSNC